MKKIFRTLIKYCIAPLFLFLIITALVLIACRSYLQHQILNKTRITSVNGIDSLEKVELGGVEQWISVRGWDRSNPVLLHLHGGPGGAEIALARFFDTELEEHFVVVRWDQRGAGKSYNRRVPAESMNMEQLIADALELTEILKRRFDTAKIYLVGHSWGSVVGARVASTNPEPFHAFVGIGQIVESSELEKLSYQFTLEKATASGNQEAIRQLTEIGPPPYENYHKMIVQRKWLEKLGGLYHSDIGNLFKMGATSPDSSLTDGFRYIRGQSFSLECMWNDFNSVDLFRQVPTIDVPVYFFLGRYDYNTPPEIVERYYEQLDAPKGKTIIWFENSGHMIPYEEPDKYCDMLVDRVLKETYDVTD